MGERGARASVLRNDAPRRVPGLADASRGRGIVDGLDPDVFATAPDMIAVSFDASPYLDRKFFALTAHRSAFGVTPEMLKNPPPGAAQMLQAFRPVFEREVFLLGGARGPVRRGRCRISSTGWRQQSSIRLVDTSPAAEGAVAQG